MKQINAANRMPKGIFITIMSIISICNIYAKNEDTPNLDFSFGNFSNWERYYAYFGPINFDDVNSSNVYSNQHRQDYYNTPVPESDQVWTLKNGDGDSWRYSSRNDGSYVEMHGDFSIVRTRVKDQNMNKANCNCVLMTLPPDFNSAAIIGCPKDEENLYNYSRPNLWKERAVADKLTYRFRVTPKSTLLKLCYASVLFEPRNDRAAHFGDEHPLMCLSVTANNGTQTRVLPCGEYCGNASSNDGTLRNIKYGVKDPECPNQENCQYTTYSSNNLTYKQWTTNIYDLRDFIGYEIVIEGYVHDCLLELYVCNNCGTCYPYYDGVTTNANGITKIRSCSYCGRTNQTATKHVMAGGHWSYGYLTGETMELRIDVDNCPDQDKVKITVPGGFGKGNYYWHTSDGVTLVDVNGSGVPYDDSVAYVNRAEIQDVDYICTIKGSNEECSDISIATRIAKEPIVMDFIPSNACFNNVIFTDKTHITEILQDGEMIEPDTITSWTWTYTDNHGISGTLTSYTKEDVEANPTLKNPEGTFEWTTANQGKYKMTLTVTTAKGCTMSYEKDFKVQPHPTLQLDGITNICEGETSVLQVTNYNAPNNRYVWKKCTSINNNDECIGESIVQDSIESTNSAFFSILGNEGNVGTYRVEIIREEDLMEGNVKIGSTQCTYHKNFVVSTKPVPSINFTEYSLNGNQKYKDICKGETTNLIIEEINTHILTENDITWSNTEKGFGIGVGPTDTTLYIVTANGNGCRTMDSIWVNVKPLPKLNIEGPSALCQNGSATWEAQGLTSATEKQSYEWSQGSTQLGKSESITVSNTQTGFYTYTLKGTNDLGCTDSTQKQLIVRANPEPNVPTVAPICEGQNVVINVYNVDSCQWNDGPMLKVPSESSVSEVPQSSSYKLTSYIYYTDTFCVNVRNIPLTINKNPEIKIEGDSGVCKGFPITLVASDTATYPNGKPAENSYAYSWNDANTTKQATLTTTPVASTSYTITMSNGTCSVSATRPVEVYNKPEFVVTPLKARVCPGERDTFIAEEGLVDYKWFIIENNNDTTFLVPSQGMPKNQLDLIINKDIKVYARGTDANGCTNDEYAQVTVKAKPVLGEIGNDHVCEGSQITIAPTGADQGTYWWTYQYKDSLQIDTVKGLEGDALIHAPNCNGCGQVTYYVHGTKDGCEADTFKTVTINPQPKVIITGDSICKGEQTTLTASCSININSWSWTGMNKTGNSITVSPITNQTYYVVATAAAGGCPGNAEFTVVVYDRPTITIEGGNAICAGKETSLSASGASKYTWTLDKASIDTTYGGEENSTIMAKLAETTLFTVAGYNEHNCYAIKTKAVLVNPYPEIRTDAKPICQGDRVDISASGAATYKWYSATGGHSQDSIGVGTRHTKEVADNATNYTVYVIGTENNCSTEKKIEIDIKPKPEIEITGKHIYCQGETIELTASFDDDSLYQWSNGDTEKTLQTAANSSITELKMIGTDKYGCSNEVSYPINVIALPAVSIRVPASTDICIGDSVELTAENAGTYQWYTTSLSNENKYVGDETCPTGACNTIKPVINATTKFIAEGIQETTKEYTNGTETARCKASAEITITARPKPVVTLADVNPVCINTSTNLTASNTEASAIIDSWEWYKNDNLITGEDKSYINTGNLSDNITTFKAVAVSNYGCRGYQEKNVTIYPLHTVEIDGNNYVCENKTIQLTATVRNADGNDVTSNARIFTWVPQGGSNAVTPEMTLANTTIFELTVTDPNGCQIQATPKNVNWIPLPRIRIEQNPEDVCAGRNEVTLTASPTNKEANGMNADGWKWLRDNNATAESTIANNITLSNLTGTTTFKVTGTDTFGCVSEPEIHVIEINDAPDLTITGVKNACLNDFIELSVSSSKNADIYWIDTECGNNGNQKATDIRRVKLEVEKAYKFKASITVDGCTTIDSLIVNVHPNPSVTVASKNGKDYVCRGGSLELAATATPANVTYSWNMSSSQTNEAMVWPTSNPTQCIVTVTDGNSCTATDFINVRIVENPILYINEKTAGDTTICKGQNLTLTATGLETGNTNYTWTPNGTGASFQTESIQTEKIYTVEGTDNNGCKGSAKYTIKTKPYPTFDAPNVTSCPGDISTVKATANGDVNADYYTWTWTDGNNQTAHATGSNYSEILEHTRTYSVTATKNGCTTDAKVVTATVHTRPTASISATDHVVTDGKIIMCYKESDKLTAAGSGNYNYAWLNGNGLTSDGAIANITPTSVGTHEYNVTITDNITRCTNTEKITAVVNEIPNVILDGSKSICYNDEATVTATGAESYVWTIGNNTVTQQDDHQYVGRLKETTTFSVVGASANGCNSLPTPYKVEVKDRLNIDWGTPTVCEGEDKTITVSNATSIKWKTDNETTGSTRTLENIHATNDVYAEYPITAYYNGCSIDTIIRIQVNSKPVITFDASNAGTATGNLNESKICINDKIELHASASESTIKWNTGSVEPTGVKESPITTSTYTATATNGTTGCQSTASYKIIVNPRPVIKINNELAGESRKCEDDPISLVATGLNATTGYTWSKSDNKEDYTPLTPTTSNTYSTTATRNVYYKVTGTDENGCSANATYDIIVNKKPNIAPQFSEVCAGANNTISLNERTPNTQYSWSWANASNPTQHIGSLSNATSVTHNFSENRIYTINAKSNANCLAETTFTIPVKPLPRFTVTPDQTICHGRSVTLEAEPIGQASYSYEWKKKDVILNANGSRSITDSTETTTLYTVNVTDGNGCSKDASVTVTVNPLPNVNIIQEGAACVGNTVKLKPTIINESTSDNYTFTWYDQPETNGQRPSIGTNDYSMEITYSTAPTTTLYLTAVNKATQCPKEITKSINKTNKPEIEALGDLVRCNNNIEGTIRLSGAEQYKWTSEGDKEGSSLTEVLTENKTYSIHATSGACYTDTTIPVIVNPLPTVAIKGDKGNYNDTTICLHSNATLTAETNSQNPTYSWNTNEETQNIKVTAETKNAQTYTVTVTDESTHCKNKGSFVVNVHPQSNVQIEGLSEICTNDKIVLTANANYQSYQWAYINAVSDTTSIANGNGKSLTYDLNDTTTFILNVVDQNGCKNNASKIVNAKPLPFIAYNTPIVCLGKKPVISVDRSRSVADYYEWPDNSQNNTSWTSPDALTNEREFTFKAYLNGCPSKDSTIKIAPKALPNIVLKDSVGNTLENNGNSEVCLNNNKFVIEAEDNKTNTTKWSWNIDQNEGNRREVHPTVQTTYQITAENDNHCTSSTSYTVKVNTPTPIIITGVNKICENGSTTLTAEGGSSYSWSFTPSIDASNLIYSADASSVTINNCKETFVATVKGKDNKSCSSESEGYTVIVNKNPTLTITPGLDGRKVCVQSPLKLSATGGTNVSIQWENGEAGHLDYTYIPTESEIGSKKIKVTGTSTDNCTTVDSIYVTVNALPVINITGADICQGKDTTLTAGSNETVTFHWLGYNEQENPITVNKQGRYTVEATNNNGCKNTASYDVTAYSLPSVSIVRRGIDFTDDKTVCEGSTLQLEAIGSGSTYEWYNGNTRLNSTGDSGQFISPIITNDQIFTVIAKESHRTGATILTCQSTETYEAKKAIVPSFTITADNVCKGKSSRATITNPNASGITYVWSWNDDTQNGGTYHEEPSLNERTEYTVVGTLGHCTATKTGYADIWNLPSLSIISTNPVGTEMCLTGSETKELSVTATATNGNGTITDISWSSNRDARSIGTPQNVPTGSSSSSTVVISPTQTGKRTYTVSAQDNNQCKNSANIEINVNDIPSITILGDRNVCPNTTASLTVQGTYSVKWYKNDGITPIKEINDGSAFTPTITKDTSFVVEINDGTCSNKQSVDITTKKTPTIQFKGESSVCIGSTAEITLVGNSGGKNYLKQENGAYSTTSQTSLSLTPKVIGETTYNIRLVSAEGCETDTSIKITAKALPEIKINNQKNGSSEICFKDPTTLTASGAGDNGSYVWNNRTTSSENEVVPLTTTTYYVVGTNATTQCKDTAWHTVNVKDLPKVEIASKEKVCVDSTVTLSIKDYKSEYTYTWSNESWANDKTGESVTATIANGANKFVVICDDNSSLHCKGKAEKTITSKPNPEIEITGNNQVCQNDYVTLTASSSLPSSTYLWEEGNDSISVLSSITQKVDKAHTYHVTVEKNGCTKTESVTTRFFNLPDVKADITNDVNDDNVICVKSQAELSATVTSGTAPYTYLWKSNYIDSENKDKKNPITMELTNANVSYDFIVEVTDDKLCKGVDTVTVSIRPNPTIRINGDLNACDGQEATIWASGAGANGTYKWSTNDITDTIHPVITADATFTVTGTDNYLCKGTSKEYTIYKKPNPTLYFSGKREVCFNSSTAITVSGAGADGNNYTWTNKSGDSAFEETNGTFQPLSPTTTSEYNIHATMNGCSTDSVITITVNELPEIKIIGVKDNTTYNNGVAYICIDESIQLQESQNDDWNYLWSTNKTDNSIEVAPSASTTYSLRVTDKHTQCSTTDSFTVNVKERPIVDLITSPAICKGDKVHIEAQAKNGYPTPNKYSWNGGSEEEDKIFEETLSDPSKVYQLTTQYTEDGITCTYTTETTIETKAKPDFSLSGTEDICTDDLITLEARAKDGTSVDYYLWPDNNENTLTRWSTGTSNLTGQSSVTYTVKGTNKYASGSEVLNCTHEESVDITIHPRPELEIDGPAFICKNASSELTVRDTAGNTIANDDFRWSTGETGTTITVPAPNETVTYSVTATLKYNDTEGCDATASFMIYGKDNPSFDIIGKRSYCDGTNASLSIAGTTNIKTIQWFDVVGTDSTLISSGTSISPKVERDMIIAVRVINTDDCVAEKSIPITWIANPTLQIDRPDKVCEGATANIIASGANSWSWDHTSKTVSTLNEIINTSTVFTVHGTTNGCTTDSTFTIGTYAMPEISITADKPIQNKQTEICYKESITLTATGAETYIWENMADGNNATITKSPSNDITYIVEGTDVNGCKNKESIKVVVNSLPEFTVPAITKVCENLTTTIKASNQSLSYNWGDGYGTKNYEYTTPAVTDDVTYTVTAKNSKGCVSDPVSYQLIKKHNPDLVISGENKICYNTSTTLSVSDNADQFSSYQTTYVWENNNSNIGSTFTTKEITKKTTISVKGTKEGCSTTKTWEIDTFNLPNILINNGDEYAITCSNNSVTLEASNGVSYKWDNKPGESDNTYSVRPTVDGEVHTLWGKDRNGCVNTDDIKVNIQYRPNFRITGNNRVCNGSNVVLKVTPNDPNSNYKYRWTDKFGERIGKGAGTNKHAIRITSDTTVYVTATDQTGLPCDTTIAFEIKVKNKPTITPVKVTDKVCKMGYATIVVGGDADSYQWKYGSSIVSETNRLYHVINNDNNRFIVTATKDGCTENDTFDVIGVPIPKVTLGNATICYGDKVELKANEGLDSYQWDNITAQTAIVTSEMTNSLEVDPKITTQYRVIGGQIIDTDGNQCKDTAIATVTVNPLPQIVLNNDKNACEEGTVEISTTDKSLVYSWENHGESYESLFSHEYTMGNYPESSEFVIYAKTQEGCIDSSTVSINTKPKPTLDIVFDSAVCYGKTATMSGLNPLVRYTWKSDEETLSTSSSYTTPTITDAVVNFNVTGIMDGCSTDSLFSIKTRDLPTIKIEGSPSITICRDNTIDLNVENPTKGWSYKWDNNAYTINDTIYHVYPIKETTYKLFGKDTFGCENKDEIIVSLQERPTFHIVGVEEICVNGEATLQADNDNLRYVWLNSKNDTIGKTVGNEALSIKITQDTTLTVHGYTNDNLACEESATHSIKANSYPVISVVKADKAVCYNTQAYIEVKTDIDATFLWDNNKTERYIQEIITKNKTKFHVKAISTDETHCTSDTTITVNMYKLPVIITKDTVICYGDTARLLATSKSKDVTFRWYDASENGEYFTTPTLTSPTTYTVKGTDKNGCVGENKAIVSINSLPQFKLSSNSPICRGDEVTIQADDNTLSYVWEDNKDGDYTSNSEYKHAVGQDTTFIVWAKDNNKCQSKKEISVKVKEFPVLSLRMDIDTVCYGESRTIYVTGANNGYVWSDGSTNNYLKLDNVTEKTEIYVEGTTNNCTSRIDTAIKVWALPTIKIEDVSPICLYQSTELTATGGASGNYKWSTGETTDRITVTPSKSGITTYSVNGTDIHGCKGNDEIDVTVRALPKVSINGEEYICRGQEVSLKTGFISKATYEWHTNGEVIEGANTRILKTTIEDDAQTFWVVVKDAYSCVDSASYEVKAKDYPILSHKTNTGRDSVCYDGTILIYVSGAESYKWEDGSEDNSFAATLTKPTTFHVEGTTNGCTTPYTITIDTLQLPIFTITAKDAICLNDSVELIAGGNLVEGRIGTLDYKWRHNGETTPSITESPLTTKTYNVTGTDEYGCKSIAEHTVTVNQLPTDLKINGQNAICKNEEVTLTASSATAVRYDWITDENGSDTIWYDTDEIKAVIESDTTFFVVATDHNACQFTTKYDVTKIDHPTLDYTYKEEVCYGSKSTISVKGATSYVWDNDNSTKNYRTDVITQDTVFTVVGTSNGCKTTLDLPIKVLSLPTISIETFNADDNTSSSEICKGQGRIKLNAKGGISGKYTWSTKEKKDHIIVSPSNTTVYSVVGEDKYGCQNSADTVITVHPLPIVTIEGINESCEKDTFELVAKSTDDFEITKYEWTGYDDFKDKDTLKAYVTSNQTFYVKVTDKHNCYNSASHNVDSKAYPKLILDAPSYVCYGNSAIVSVKGASTYKWVSDKEITQRSFVDVPEKDTTYIVQGTTNGCTSTDSISVNVKELPEIKIESENNISSICLNDSIILKGQGGISYTWNTGATNNQIVVHPLVDTKYTVTGKDNFGCTNNAEFTVRINALPNFEIKGQELVCEGDVDTLWIEGDPATYTWVSHADVITDTLKHAIDKDQLFKVKAVNENNCISFQTKTVKMKKYPTININAPTAVCDGTTATLTATGAATYKWDDDRTDNSITDTITETKTYTVYGTTNGCTSQASTTVKKWDLPNVQISGANDEICFGQTTYMQASGATSYIWSNGSTQTGISVSPTTTTEYYLIGKSANNCESRDTFTITVNPLPVVTIQGNAAICEGKSTELIAQGAKTYVWSPTTETTDTIRPIISSTQIFTVIGTDENGCSSSATKQIKKKDNPKLTYNAPSTICKGKMTSIIVLGANGYKWETGETGNTINVIPDEPTTYKVIGNTDGCLDSLFISINIWELPDVSISGTDKICINQPVTLTAQGANSYIWSTGLQTDVLTTTPLSTTTYSVTGTDVNGCENTVKHTVTVNPLPDFNIEGDNAVCEGMQANLTAVSNTGESYDYIWTWSENGESRSINDNTVSADIYKNTTFTVEAKDQNLCTNSITKTIYSKAYPTISFAAPTDVCQGEGINITAFGANEYEWSTGSTTSQMSDIQQTAGIVTYNVKGTTNDCSTDASISVNIKERPQVFIDGETVICSGESVSLKAYGAKYYEWSNGISQESIEAFPTIDAKYTVKGTNEIGCSDTTSIIVTVNQKPAFDIISDDEICVDHDLTMIASGDAKTYYWGYGDKNYDDNISFNNSEVIVPISRPTYIFVKGVDNNGCVNEKFKQIKTIAPPSIFYTGETDVCLGSNVHLVAQGGDSYIWTLNNKNIAGSTLTFEPKGNTSLSLTGTLGMCTSTINIEVTTKDVPELEIIGKTSICKGESTTLMASGAASYIWNNGETSRSITNILKNSTTFTVVGTGYNGCSSVKSTTVKVNPLPNVRLHLDYKKGCPEVGTDIKLSATGAENYIWHCTPKDNQIEKMQGKNVEATIFDDISISVIGTDDIGCTGFDTIQIKAEEFKPTLYQVTPRVIEDKNPVISMDGQYPETSNWSWDPGDGSQEIYGRNVVYRYPETYGDSFLVKVAAVDKDGCTYRGETTVYVWKDFWAPNAFTPNGDDLNSTFRFVGTEFITSMHFIIYNRLGTIVFEGNSKLDEWDGYDLNGNKCPEGVYGYVVTYKSDFLSIHKSGEKKGSVTLIR